MALHFARAGVGGGRAAAASGAPPASAGGRSPRAAVADGRPQHSGRLGRALPGGSGHYLTLCSSPAAFVRRSACLFPRVDPVPAVWRLVLVVNFCVVCLIRARGLIAHLCKFPGVIVMYASLQMVVNFLSFILIMHASIIVCVNNYVMHPCVYVCVSVRAHKHASVRERKYNPLC